MAKSKDLFDETSMSFGEHLEALRGHLWKAIIGLVICVIAALFFGTGVVNFVRQPLDNALTKYGLTAQEDLAGGSTQLLEHVRALFGDEEAKKKIADAERLTIEHEQKEAARKKDEIELIIKVSDIKAALAQLDEPDAPIAADAAEAENNDPADEQIAADKASDDSDERTISIAVTSPAFATIDTLKDRMEEPITLTVQEPFMTYIKVAFVTGLVMASPWVFYQMWLFIAAGLYSHERRYVHLYLPMSLALFLGGALFCFYFVIPTVLDFLLSFNKWLGVNPQIRLSEWISFALMLPLMFGISFQLPIAMLFLERISIFDSSTYRQNRRMAILVIAVLSMFLTPQDPQSMLLMMFPLIILYEFGILMCDYTASKRPFQEKTT